MQRQRGSAAEKLLFSIVLLSLVLMTFARTTNRRLNDFILEEDRPIQLNGIKNDAINMFDKFIKFLYPIAALPPTAARTRSKSKKNVRAPSKLKRRAPSKLNRNDRTQSKPLKNVEHFTIHKVIGDGRCMFRALVKGMAANDGVAIGPKEETQQADELKMEVKRVICDSNSEHEEFDNAIIAITVEESLEKYCKRIIRDGFWGGEAELLVLSKLLSLPVIVYMPAKENLFGIIDKSAGFISVTRYSPEFKNGTIRAELKKDVRLLFLGNHYDLLI